MHIKVALFSKKIFFPVSWKEDLGVNGWNGAFPQEKWEKMFYGMHIFHNVGDFNLLHIFSYDTLYAWM